MALPSDPAQPIPAHLFALAIKDLPLDTLYAKAAELQNSISHLLSSNIQMKPYADEGDAVCREAIVENDAVIARMEERVRLCRDECQERGQAWSAHATNGQVDDAAHGLVNGESGRERGPRAQPSGRLTDEELRRQLEAQMGGDEGEDGEDGVHL